MTATPRLDEDAALVEVGGIGEFYQARLAAAGVTTVRQLADADVEDLARRASLSPTAVRRWRDDALRSLGEPVPWPDEPLKPVDADPTPRSPDEDEPGPGARLWEGFKTVLAGIAVVIFGVVLLAIFVAIGLIVILFFVFLGFMILSLFR